MIKTTRVLDMIYVSDGLKIHGYMIFPRDLGNRPLPVLVFNHGGNRNYGRLLIRDLIWLNRFAAKGYLVVASQYRGVDGSEGVDEFGGSDVDDVLNIAALATALPFADPGRLYMVGHSRGGMMTYLTLKNSKSFNAAVVLAGECDLMKGLEAWPSFERDVYAEMIPNYATDKTAQLAARSSCDWPEKISTPVYIMQGDQDDKVEPAQATMMAAELRALGKPIKLKIFQGGKHDLFFRDPFQSDVVSEIDDWFSHHASRASVGVAPQRESVPQEVSCVEASTGLGPFH